LLASVLTRSTLPLASSPDLTSARLTAPASPAQSVMPSTMLRDPQLDALLAAHRQFGGTSALQMPSGFLRNATYTEGAP
jgi:sigma-E factor negative regulatory protein RseA